MKTYTVELTEHEILETLRAVSNFTQANSNDIAEMKLCGVQRPKDLLRAEHLLRVAYGMGSKLTWKARR